MQAGTDNGRKNKNPIARIGSKILRLLIAQNDRPLVCDRARSTHYREILNSEKYWRKSIFSYFASQIETICLIFGLMYRSDMVKYCAMQLSVYLES